ncbi:MAG: CAP domain-containing protein, partial [Blautia sp.]|nr:CAP domain-containing protein [Blautia sp.]
SRLYKIEEREVFIMKKKWIALLLSVTLITAGAAPTYAAEFSDGTSGTEVSNDLGSGNDSFDFTDSASVENGFASEEGGMPAVEEAIPVIDDLMSSAEAAAVEGDMYTINFEGELILDQTQEFVRLLNIEREKLGVPPVQIDQKMMEKAILRAPEVAVYFAHKRPDTGGPVNTYYADSAECIDYVHSDTKNGLALQFIKDFKRSEGHWKILTDKNYTRIGAAICGVPWTKRFGGIKENGCVRPSEFSYTIVVPQIGIAWGVYEPYSGNYTNEKTFFSQKIGSKYFNGLSGEGIVYHPLNTGEKCKFRPEAVSGKHFYEIVAISPNGYWKSMTPGTVSVDQNGTVTGLAPGEGIVRYCLGDEFSEFLFEVTGNPSVKKPSTPSVTGSVSSYVNAKLSWKKTSNTKGYQIYRYNSKTKKYNRIKTLSASATSFTEKLGYGKTAQYKVRAYNKGSSGKTVYGNFSSVKIVKTSPGTPALTKVSNSSKGKLKLTWKRPSGAEGYVIYRKVGKTGSYKKVKTITSAKALNYTNGGLKKGTTYYYKIRAYRKGADKKNIYSKWSKVIGSTCR